MKFTTFKAIKTTTLATATLLASGLAAAQTVQLNGVVDAFAGQRQLSGRAKLKTLDSGGMTTSRWGVEGSEDPGGGLKASFALSGFLRADTGEAGRWPWNSDPPPQPLSVTFVEADPTRRGFILTSTLTLPPWAVASFAPSALSTFGLVRVAPGITW